MRTTHQFSFTVLSSPSPRTEKSTSCLPPSQRLFDGHRRSSTQERKQRNIVNGLHGKERRQVEVA